MRSLFFQNKYKLFYSLNKNYREIDLFFIRGHPCRQLDLDRNPLKTVLKKCSFLTILFEEILMKKINPTNEFKKE